MHRIQDLIRADQYRMEVLRAVASLALPDCYVAAGFVRNLVWDVLHGFEQTELNDIDVVYYDKSDTSAHSCSCIENDLNFLIKGINWEVKNQAIMHLRNNDHPYKSTVDAMSFWPEKETAVGVRLSDRETIDVVAPFGLETLFNGKISYNEKRSIEIFESRIVEKQWLTKWPLLRKSVKTDKRSNNKTK